MNALSGKCVLVVEDEFLIATMIADVLIAAQATVVGPAWSAEQALELARSARLDAAVLDINLRGCRSDAVAQELRMRGIPFVVATGYADDLASDVADACIIISKPFTEERLLGAVSHALR